MQNPRSGHLFGATEIHSSKKCVTQRVVTDNIFELETAAIAMRTCNSEDPGILLTNFSCAYSSVDHRWIFMVLKRAGVPVPSGDFC